jgi:hypothetical protein
MDTRSCEAPGVWWVEARYKGKSVRPRLKVTIEEYPELDLSGFSIGNEQKVCHGNVPAQLKATGSPSGGDGAYDYQWQQSSDGVNGWTDVKDSTNTTLTPPALTSGTYYRLKVASCTTDSSNVVKITVRSSSLYNYPDLRVSVCPDAGASINLSKYIDTLDVSSLSWESVAPHIPISSAIAGPVSTGTILADDLNAYTRVYTLAYTVSNPCTSNVRRIVYLETLKNGKVRPLRDSTVICHKYAEAIQVNQIFGIDARGTWSFAAYESDGVTPVNIDAYVAESQSPTYNGAVIMNGKAIYENTAARKIMVTYTPSAGSCVAGRSFTTKIVLTDV